MGKGFGVRLFSRWLIHLAENPENIPAEKPIFTEKTENFSIINVHLFMHSRWFTLEKSGESLYYGCDE